MPVLLFTTFSLRSPGFSSQITSVVLEFVVTCLVGC